MVKTRIDSKLAELRTMVAEIDNDLVEERWACRRAITRAETAEARVKELEEALQFIANCCPEWTARTTAENALKGKVEL